MRAQVDDAAIARDLGRRLQRKGNALGDRLQGLDRATLGPDRGGWSGVMNCPAPVSRVVFSPDGERVLLVIEDKTARIWPVAHNESIALRGHTDAVLNAVFSPDGSTLATASADGTTRIWDPSPGPRPIVLSGPHAPWSEPVFSRDGRRLVTACADNVTRLWDVATGRVALEVRGHAGPVVATAISSDGRRLATAGSDRIARGGTLCPGKSSKSFAGMRLHLPPSPSALTTASLPQHLTMARCALLESRLGPAPRRAHRPSSPSHRPRVPARRGATGDRRPRLHNPRLGHSDVQRSIPATGLLVAHGTRDIQPRRQPDHSFDGRRRNCGTGYATRQGSSSG